jgi:hypothetical protein
MSTARCIARHEIRSAWRDGRFLAGAGVVQLLLSIALAADHHVRWREFFVARITRIPVFAFTPEPELLVRSRVWRSPAGLLIPLGVFVAAAAALIGRYRPV